MRSDLGLPASPECESSAGIDTLMRWGSYVPTAGVAVCQRDISELLSAKKRKLHRECRSLTGACAMCANRPALMIVYNGFGERQPEAESAEAPRDALMRLHEGVENCGQRLSWMPMPVSETRR
jgi:hypothetical protein